jgi:hypothetical protein
MLEAAPWAVPADGATIGKAWGSLTHQPRILEPCAGEGLIVQELRGANPLAVISAIELRDVGDLRSAGVDFWGTADALSDELPWSKYDLVLTNPPFSLWHEFAEKALKAATWTALLLRMGAAAHLEGLPTPSLYILPDRPIFAHKVEVWRKGFRFAQQMIPWNAPTPSLQELLGPEGWFDNGKWEVRRKAQSDASEYAWLVWGPQAPTVHILAKTPLAERKPKPRGLELAA